MSGREDRRRRVLRDDGHAASSAPSARKTKSNAERYTDQAKREELPRLIDLVPKRAIWICLWFALGLGSIVAMYFADVSRVRYLSQVSEVSASELAITGYATLASWWSTVCFLGCSLLAALIYTIRCHRIDDYRGRYRQWAIVSMLCLFASASLAAPIHQTIQSLAVHLTGRTFSGRPALWWVLPWSFVGFIAGLRALLDMRPCKSGPFFLVVSAGCYFASALGYFGVLNSDRIATSDWLPVTFLTAHYCLFWSLCLFARYVYLDAQGQLAIKVKKIKRARKSKPKKTGDEHADDVIPMEQVKKRRRSETAVEADDDGDEESPDQDEMSLAELELLTNPDLTRAEKRKLRKKVKRDRRAA